MPNTDELINVEFTCPICGMKHYIYNIRKSLVERVKNRRQTGEYVQDILKDYSPVDREKFLTEFCEDCQKIVFGASDD